MQTSSMQEQQVFPMSISTKPTIHQSLSLFILNQSQVFLTSNEDHKDRKDHKEIATNHILHQPNQGTATLPTEETQPYSLS